MEDIDLQAPSGYRCSRPSHVWRHRGRAHGHRHDRPVALLAVAIPSALGRRLRSLQPSCPLSTDFFLISVYEIVIQYTVYTYTLLYYSSYLGCCFDWPDKI